MSLWMLLRQRRRRVGELPLAMSRGAVLTNNVWFGQAADLYDTVGVNTHWHYGGSYSGPNTRLRIYELGLRHYRDMTVGSWYDFRWQFQRGDMISIRQRNAALPAPSATDAAQPLFIVAGTTDWPGVDGQRQDPVAWSMASWFQVFSGVHQHYNGDTNSSLPGAIPGVGGPISNGTTSNPAAAIPNPWNFADPEIPWSGIAAMQGPNEPGDRANVAGDDRASLTQWTKSMFTIAKTKTAETGITNPYVTTEGISTEPMRVSQIPVMSPSVNTNIWALLGDWSQGTDTCDVGDLHMYSGGHDRAVEEDQTELNNCDSYNGDQHAPADRSRALPMMASEWGYHSRGVKSAQGALDAGAHSGYWPAPADVIAEYMLRTILIRYRMGFRRTYIYEMNDQVNNAVEHEWNFGLITWDHQRKQQFYAIKNFMRIVGFTEAPAALRAPIAYTISGFVGSGAVSQTRAFLSWRDTQDGNALGSAYRTFNDRLDHILIQQSANVFLLFVWRQASLWDREPGNKNPSTGALENLADVPSGRRTPNTQNLTVNLPSGVASVGVCQPTSGIDTQAPTDATPPGQTFAPVTITSNTVPLQIVGHTKVLKITMSEGVTPPPPQTGLTPAVVAP